MPTVEELELQINATAQQANSRITALAKKLDTLSTSLKKIEGININSTTAAIQQLSGAVGAMKGVSTKKFEDLANGISAISKVRVNPQQYIDLSNSLTQLSTGLSSLNAVNSNIVKFVDATARLANAGQNIAITTGVMPRFSENLQSLITTVSQAPVVSQSTIQFTSALGQLASTGARLGTVSNNLSTFGTELSKVITTLSQAPQVSANTIQLTNALANLASQSSKVGSASRNLTSGLNRTSSTMQKTSKSATSLAAAFGKFYANYFLFVRGFKGLWKSVESAMDYIEVANYFNEAFAQVAKNADYSAFEELGYETAEAYADSFAERAKELTAKMTGYQIGETGSLTATGAASLGINPSDLMKYQAMFGQMSSSMGVASETSLKLSNALTMIGADLASIKNMDFEDTWQSMSSGIVGMSRSWDKYGVNIRNVNLQQKLNELGIEASIDALNQQDKALLRGIILLENSRYAWGDLAETISQPANQLRLLEASMENFARTFGGLFIGLVTQVMPYINGLMIALERMVRYVGDLFGVDWDSAFAALGSSGGDNTIISDILDEADEASSSVKALQRQLLGFDEINKLGSDSENKDATAGLGDVSAITSAFDDIYDEYTETWQKSFDKVENNANKFADNIIKKLNKISKKLQPLKEPFDMLIQSLQGLSEFSFGALEEFYTNFLDPVGNWMINDNSGIARFLDITTKLNNNIDWESLKNAVGDLSSVLATISLISWNTLMSFYDNFLEPIGEWVLGEGILKLVDILERMVSGIDWDSFDKVVSGVLALASDIITDIADSLLNIAKDVEPYVTPVINSIIGAFEELLNILRPVWNFIDEYILPVLEEKIGAAIKTALSVITGLFDNIKTALSGVVNFVSGVFTGNWEKAFGGLKDIVTGIFNSLTHPIDMLGASFEGLINGIKVTFNKLKPLLTSPLNAVLGMFEGFVNKIIGAWNVAIEALNSIGKITINGTSYGGMNIPLASTVTIPRFVTGGFPEDGLFMANHGELVGKFSNGKTAVANNEQIVAGIEAGVYNAVVAALSTASNNNSNVTVILEGDASELFRVVQDQGRDYQRRYNREVFA